MKTKTFGELVKLYRKQRGLTQEELAVLWDCTRTYVIQIENGRRTLLSDYNEQVERLREILQIPAGHLESIAQRIPTYRIVPERPQQADDALLQALLLPAQATVKLSWLTWSANKGTSTMTDQLYELIIQLDDALTRYHGQFVKPAQALEAYTHEMLGKIAYDGLDLQRASRHFQEMLDLGEELSDADIIVLATAHQGDLLRKRGRYVTAQQRFDAAQNWIEKCSPYVQSIWYRLRARSYSLSGDQENFERSLDAAQHIIETAAATPETQLNEHELVEVLQERGQGYTMLWQPQKALAIYQQTDELRPFRPLRDLGSYTIIKAQAYAYAGEIEQGVELAINGVRLARLYGSKRHIARVENMYNRLHMTPLGKTHEVKELHDFLSEQ